MSRRLLGYLAGYKLKVAGVLLTMLVSTSVGVLKPWPMKVLVDNVLGQQPLFGHVLDGTAREVVVGLTVLASILLAALNGGVGLVYQRWLTEISQKASLDLSRDLYAQAQRLSLRFHDRARIGDMVTRLTSDVEQLQKAFIAGLYNVVVNMLTVVGMAVVMFVLDWQLALIALVVLPPLFLIFVTFRDRVREASRAVRSSQGSIASAAYETLSSIRVVKAFGQERRERERFVDHTRSKVEASVRAATWDGMFYLAVEAAGAAGVGIVMGSGAWRVLRGDVTLGQVLVFMQYLNTMYSSLQELTRLTSTIQKASASAERIHELFEAAPEVRESPTAIPLKRSRGRIVFDDVWFGYEPDRPVLRGINLEIDEGEVLAVVGPTGAGKSTLVSLIPRFYDPTAGRMLLDGEDLRHLRLHSLRDQISIVLQDPVLFSGSIRDNIAYGRPDATDPEVVDAARAAYAHEFIIQLPDGYDSCIGERGATLSGGQRQRIAIARALLKDAPMLILDEPTSSVDSESERIIMEALARVIHGRTVIIITHRMSAAKLAGRVAVLMDGEIVETGAREHLRESGRFYRRLHAQ